MNSRLDDDRNEKAADGVAALNELLHQEIANHLPPPEARRPFIIGWGLVNALNRQAHAVLLLHGRGMGHEASPNRRLMIEYLAHLEWLARDGENAADSLNKTFQHTHAKLRAAADAGGFVYDAEVAALADAVAAAVIPSDAANQYASTSKLLERLDAGLLAAWTAETQSSHSGLSAARTFFDDSDPNQIRLFDAPHYGMMPDPDEATPFMAFILLYCGVQAFNELVSDRPWTVDLERIGAEHGLAGDVPIPADRTDPET